MAHTHPYTQYTHWKEVEWWSPLVHQRALKEEVQNCMNLFLQYHFDNKQIQVHKVNLKINTLYSAIHYQ